ncbi:MAG TPA: MBL fold metallo-hydrolase [Ignavibacteriaceae bacterium]|nr:MBL fold metallo-hydrolase [Ignavibacteriaceae bacterium]
MEIIFLGTSAGKPTRTRNLSAIAVKPIDSKDWCLVDCGEGTQYRILNSNLSLSRLKTILITHVHGDHVYGLPGLLGTAAMDGRQNELDLVAPINVIKFIVSALENTFMHLTYKLNFIPIEELKDELSFGDIKIKIVKLSHGVDSYAFVFTREIIKRKLNIEKLKEDNVPQGPLWGKLQNEQNVEINGKIFFSKDYLNKIFINKNTIICGDNDNPKMLDKVIKGTDILVHEATFTSDADSELLEVSGHCTAENIAKYAEEKKVPNLILTHFSSRYADVAVDSNKNSIKDIEEEAKKFYKGSLYLANDNVIYLLNDDKILEKK